MQIYLAGSIPKGDEEAKGYVNWRLHYQEKLEKVFPDASFIDPFRLSKDEGNPKVVFGEDCMHIQQSDLVVIRADERLGAGTSMEFVIAKYFKKPVITVIAKDTHHRRSNVTFDGKLVEDWIHPFVWAMSDFIVESVQEIEYIKERVLQEKPRDISYIDEAIDSAKKANIR